MYKRYVRIKMYEQVLNQEKNSVKVWTNQDGTLSFSINVSLGELETGNNKVVLEHSSETVANMVKNLVDNLSKKFTVITENVETYHTGIKDIEISNANKDNVKHVTVTGNKEDKIIATYNNALKDQLVPKNGAKK